MSSTIFEVLEQGPIVAGDEDMGYLVTINGSYLNLWSSIVEERRPGTYMPVVVWNNIDCRPTGQDMYSMTSAKAWDLGKEYLREVLSDIESGDDDDAEPEE